MVTGSPGRTGRKHQRLCLFQCSDSLLTRNAGELLQELVKRFSTFQVVQKILKRDAGATEDGLAAENFGVLHDDAFRACSHCKPPARFSIIALIRTPSLVLRKSQFTRTGDAGTGKIFSRGTIPCPSSTE